MPLINRWLEYLNQMQVRYSHSVHPRAETARATAEAERVPAHEFAKTVVYFSEKGYGLAVVPADEFVDMEKLALLLRLQFVRLATEMEIAELFPDCELGAMPPVGQLYMLPVYLDAAMAEERLIAFNGGTHRDVIHMLTAEFRRIVRPVIAPLTRIKAAHG